MSELIDDALAKVNTLGTVGAMKWLAAALAANTSEDAKDAARYRWLRNPDPQPERTLDVCEDGEDGAPLMVIEGEELDERIDAALATATSQAKT